MLTVRIEHPRDGLIGLLEIRNDLSQSTDGEQSPRGSYDWTLWKKSGVGTAGMVKEGRAEDFDRSRGSWELVREILELAASSDSVA